MKRGILFMMIAAVLAGCGKSKQLLKGSPSANPVEITDVQELTFGEQGSSVPEVTGFTLTRTEEGTCIRLENAYWDEEYEHMEEKVLMEQVREILETYDVGSWNGFSDTNSMVLDGESFYIAVKFVDGTELLASGSNSFPPNYKSVVSELKELIEPTRKLWRDESSSIIENII